MSQHTPSSVRPEAPTEVVFLPQASWRPALIAVGLLAMLAGTFMGAIYAVAGIILAVPALIGWIRESRSGFATLPRQQPVATAVLPPLPEEAVPAPSLPPADAQ